MSALAEFGLGDSELDDIYVFWRHRCADDVSRRLVTTGDYGTSSDYLQRLLRFLRAGSHRQSLQSQLLALRDSGAVISLILGDHCLGLMRPYILNTPGAVSTTATPFIICFERDGAHDMPDFPIVAPSRQAAVAVVRKLHAARAVDTRRWRHYESEPLLSPLHKLALDVHNGGISTLATELERRLAVTLHPAPARRRAA